MHRAKAWIEAMRLRTLPVSVAGVVVGCGCAAYHNSFAWPQAAICLLFAVIAQICSNFANEYYDYRNGLDRKGREGFRRGVTEGDISPGAMKRATYGLLMTDALLGCTLILWGGAWLFFIGLAIGLFALAYSTGPYPLSHHGLGDAAVVVFFGFVPVTFTCYVQTQVWEWWGVTVPLSLAVGLLAACVLVVNNYRDFDDDRSVGKRTLIVLLGRRSGPWVYLSFGLSALALALIGLYGRIGAGWIAAAAVYAIVIVLLFLELRRRKGAGLNPILGMTAMLLLISSIAVATALACR